MSDVKTTGEGRNTLVLVTWGIVALLILLFIINNNQSIEWDIAFTEVAFPLWLLVLIFFGLEYFRVNPGHDPRHRRQPVGTAAGRHRLSEGSSPEQRAFGGGRPHRSPADGVLIRWL